MPITTVTFTPSVLSTISVIPFPSSSTDTSFSSTSSTTTIPDPGPSTTTSIPSHSPTSSTSSSSTSGPSSSTTTSITSDPDPSSSATKTSTHTVRNTDTIPSLAPVTSSAGRTSTITTIKVITSTLQGGRTTVVSSVVESRVLSTSDPVSGSRFSHNTGAIIGVAVSATLGVILSVFAVFFSCTRYRSSRDGQLYGRHRRHRRQRSQKEFGRAGAGWRGSVVARKDVSPIPAGPIFTQPPRGRSGAGLGAGGAPGRMNSSTRILGNHTPDDVEDDVEDDDVSWRPPLAEEDDDELGRAEHGGGVMGGIGYGYGQGFGHPHADMHGAVGGGVALPTPPESGEGKGKSSLGHSQSWGHASSGHGHTQAQLQPQVRGMGMDSALLPPDSGSPIPLADSGMSTMPAVARYVAYGYPGFAGGVGMRNLGNVGDVGVGLPPVACFGSHTGTWMGTRCEGRPNDGPQVGDEGKQGDGPVSGGAVGRRTSVIGVGGLITPRTSQGEDLSGSPTVNGASAYDTAGSGPGLERGSGSASIRGTGDGTWATTRVVSTSTSSRSKSIKDVLDRFRTLSSSTRRNSNDSGRASVLARPVSALAAAAAMGGDTNGGGAMLTRPGYDYGAVMRPQRVIGHYQQHPLNQTQMQDGPGHELKSPAPVLLADHEMGVQYSPTSVHLRSVGSSGEGERKGSASPGELGTHGRGVEEVENEVNEEESLDARGSIVREKLLDPYFLSPGGNGSSPNIEGASLRDYVDYSRRIGGMVKNHLISTTTFDTVDPDGASVSVGILG